jgi:quinol---cytochrome c reductase iron-sulfur subunit
MRPDRVVTISFVVSMLASAGLVVLYLLGGNRALEGILLCFALGGLGLGIVVWATRLLESETAVEEREGFSSESLEPGGGEPVAQGTAEEVTRRKVLSRMLAGAGGTLVAALAIPTLSLGPTPGQSLFRTKWTPGARVVTENGEGVRPHDLPLEGVVTAWPEGYVGAADSQTLLIRVDESLLDLPADRGEWAPKGVVGYSKICTHAGCPVGLYRASAHQLLCPCHQSTFDVLTGAVPVFGPAVRALPQLPLGLDDEGYLVALEDFTEPVGPSFWNVTREPEE